MYSNKPTTNYLLSVIREKVAYYNLHYLSVSYMFIRKAFRKITHWKLRSISDFRINKSGGVDVAKIRIFVIRCLCKLQEDIAKHQGSICYTL